MARKEKIYNRLPGKKRGIISINRLWAGPDHLLAVDSKGFYEDYKRFYYKDIQAFITRKTQQGKIQNILFGIITGLFLLFAVLSGDGLAIFWGILAGLILILLLVNWLLGPTCISHIQTAVQSEKLPSLSRIKTAQKAINRLRPLIQEAQGVLTQEMIRETPFRTTQTPSENNENALFKRHENGRYHTLLFGLFISDGLLSVFDLFYNYLVITLLTTAMSMAIMVFVIIALVKQHESDLPWGLKTLTWGALVYIIIAFIFGYVLMLAVLFKNPETMNNQWAIFVKFSELNPLESPWMTALFIFTIVCSSLLGFFGLVLLSQFRKAYQDAVITQSASSAISATHKE
jgi:hypothetical protein